MVLLALNDALTIEDLPPEFPGLTAAAASGPPSQALAPAPLPAAGRLADSEKVAIMAAIQAEEGNFTRAAGRLGIAKSTLYEKMKRYEIDRNTVADVGTA
jgi:transcriptional regulator of acetoin/glycerol metabolism